MDGYPGGISDLQTWLRQETYQLQAVRAGVFMEEEATGGYC